MTTRQFLAYCGKGRTNRIAMPILDVLNNIRLGEPNLKLSNINFGHFRDGEPDDRFVSPEKIEGNDIVFFINTHRYELTLTALVFVWALKHQYGAASITVVMPFMAFRRQDHPELTEEFHRNLWFVQNLKQNGADALIVCDIHSDQTRLNCQAVGLKFINVDPTPAYAAVINKTLASAKEKGQTILVDAPDFGSLLRAVRLAQELEADVILGVKKRSYTGEVSMDKLVDEEQEETINRLCQENSVDIIYQPDKIASLLKGALVVMREDELDTGATATKKGHRLLKDGAAQVFLAVTHMVCSPGWKRNVFDNTPFTHVWGGNTIYRHYEDRTGGLIKDVDMSRVIAHELSRHMDEL